MKECSTDQIPLCGNAFKNYKQVKKYIKEVEGRILPDGFTKYDAWFLVTNYGKQTEAILETYARLKDKDPAVRMIKAELHFGIRFEMVQTPMDFFIRRTGRLYFDIDSLRTYLEPVLEEFRTLTKVDKAQINAWKEQLQAEVETHSHFSLERV